MTYIKEFFELPDNLISMTFLSLIFLTIIVLFIAIWSKKAKDFLVKYYILEKEETPKSFLIWIISVIFVVRILHIFLAQPFIVDGESMYPTLQNKDLLIIDKLSYKLHEPKREDIVVFKFEKEDSPLSGRYFIKRIFGLPGDNVLVQNGATTVITKKGETIKYDEDYVKNIDKFHDVLLPKI